MSNFQPLGGHHGVLLGRRDLPPLLPVAKGVDGDLDDIDRAALHCLVSLCFAECEHDERDAAGAGVLRLVVHLLQRSRHLDVRIAQADETFDLGRRVADDRRADPGFGFGLRAGSGGRQKKQ